MPIRSKKRINSKSKRRTLKRQIGGNLIKHGRTCEKSERGEYKRIINNNGKKMVDLICKKSLQMLGKKLKSSLKKKNGTFSLGRYGKTLNNKKCMKELCWHKLSGFDKRRKKYKAWKEYKNLKDHQGNAYNQNNSTYNYLTERAKSLTVGSNHNNNASNNKQKEQKQK